jgi:alkylation response protein AidB-like acyl-CoA dehydrogenase
VDLSIPPQTQEFLDRVRAFRLSLPQRIDAAEHSGRFPPELLRECGRLGLCGMLVPREYGGSGIGPLGYVLAIEELSRASASLGVVLSVHNSVGVFPIFQFGTEEQRREFLPRLCSGEALAGFAVTEAGAGSDVSSIATTAIKRGNEWLLNGIKLFISNGEGESINVLASTRREKGYSGQTMFIVRKGDPGFRVGGTESKMGIHADETCEIVFEDCRIPADRVLGRENEGFKQAMQILDAGRIGISAQAIGSTEGALEEAISMVKGMPRLAASQTAQFRLAECAAEVEGARLLVLRAADRKQRDMGTTVAASMAKLQASTVANRVAARLVGILGAGVISGSNLIERFFRDSKVFEIYEGTSEIHQLIISRRLMGSWSFEKGLD